MHLCALFSFLALLPSAAAQLVASPASVERTVEAGETATASLTLTNTGSDEASFFVRITEPPPPRPAGFVQPRTGTALRLAPPATREAVRSPIRLGAARGALPGGTAPDALRGVATDSIFYDNGDSVPDNFLGTGEQNTVLFVAQRFSPTGAFTLDGLRAYLTTSTFDYVDSGATDLSVSVEIYDAPDPDEPRAGMLLGSTETGFQAGFEGFAEIPLDGSLTFGAGEDFFVVLEVVGPPFPAGFDAEGSDDAAGRAFASVTGDPDSWVGIGDLTGHGAAPFLIRALSGTGTSGGFLTVTPASGTLAPAADTALALDLDAARLFAGTYQRNVEIVDVATGTFFTVPVTLTVTGEGIVALSQETVDIGEVFVGSAGGVTITVINGGTAPLTITGSRSTDPELEAFGLPVGTVLTPGSEVPFAVRFAPSAPGPFTGTLTVLADVGEASVAVTATAVAAPVASVRPDSLAATLLPGDAASLPVTIANAGDGVLSYGVLIENSDGFPGGDDSVLDSLFYDDGSALPDNLLGTGEVGAPFFLAQRFSTDRAFALNAVRVFASTIPFDHHGEDPPPDSTFDPLTLSVDIYEVADPNEPTAGVRLATATTVIDEISDDFVAVPLGAAVELAAGSDVFIVVGYAGVSFPAGIDSFGTGDFEGRAFLSITGETGDWGPFPDYTGVGTPSVPLIRALSLDTSGIVVSVDAPNGQVEPGTETEIAVTVDASTAEPGLFTRTLVVVTNDQQRPRFEVPLAIVVEGSGMMALAEGWNLVSWNVDLPDPALEAVLAAVWEDVEAVRMLGSEGWTSYDAADLSGAGLSLRPGEAIWVKMRTGHLLPMEGEPVPVNGLDLDAGLSAVAYLPGFVDLADHAFSSIAGASESVQSFHSTGVAYAPGVPAAFQTLGTVRPGMGYLAHTSAPVRLDYPLVAATHPFEGVPMGALVAAEREAGVTPSPAWMSVWGQGLAGLAAGTLVTAVDPDGVVSGAFTVQTDGAIGLMALYGDDPATEADEGARPGDTVALRTEAGELARVVWTEAGAVLDVSGQAVSNESEAGLPATFALRSTYPNPFAGRTSVAFDLAAAADVSLDVYDATGRRVATLVRGPMPAGAHEATWEARGAASGLYVVTLRAGDFLATRTMVLVR
ncbi:MAG: choice-of-anchor D domain-containing protein [Bacteroidota bacterium]